MKVIVEGEMPDETRIYILALMFLSYKKQQAKAKTG